MPYFSRISKTSGVFKKLLSAFIIFSLLCGTTFRVPILFFGTYAESENYHSLVSVIVSEDVYDELSSEVKRYAQDIQNVLENTKVVILPTPKNTSVQQIASLNESLFYEGYDSVANVNYESRLVGTVLVGELPVPIVYDGDASAKTILPYTDFEDKSYIFNHITGRYEKNADNRNGISAEIWHGVISPNTGDFDDNIQALEDYFDKNHDFYTGDNNFDVSKEILNGSRTEALPEDYDPFTIYFDGFREEKSLSYSSYQAYQAYLNNKEDILYNRFSKKFAEKLKSETIDSGDNEVVGLADKIGIDLGTSQSPDLENIPDIQTRSLIKNLTKQFLEIFSKGTFGDFRKDVFNAGRYNKGGSKVNVDLVPTFVTLLDTVNDQVLKDVNADIEIEINNHVTDNLQSNIRIPSTLSIQYKVPDLYPIPDCEARTNRNGSQSCVRTNRGNSPIDNCTIVENACYGSEIVEYTNTFKNILNGKQISDADFTAAKQCSIYRGASLDNGTLVEANRGRNTTLAQSDAEFLKNKKRYPDNALCLQQVNASSPSGVPVYYEDENGDKKRQPALNPVNFKGYYGGSTGLNLDPTGTSDGEIRLNPYKVDQSIIPLFDILGSKEVSVTNKDSTSYSYQDCLENNYFTKLENKIPSEDYSRLNRTPYLDYRLPIDGQNAYKWACNVESRKFNYAKKYTDLSCTGLTCTDVQGVATHTTQYKSIPSVIIHASPTAEEIKAQIVSGSVQSLSIDKNRYIDFQNKSGVYQRIDYPQLFRLGLESGVEVTLENVDLALKTELERVSALTGIDLYAELKSRGDKTLTIGGDDKKVNYYDSLVFAIYWNNLTSVSAKYKFIFENYFSDQFDEGGFNFYLPKNKKQYEIAYIGAQGDAQNMYVKLDPESKGENPYLDIISKNTALDTALLGAGIAGLGVNTEGNSDNQAESPFKCAPPNGVPIWEWIPAVTCWLDNLLPAKIGISDGTCGVSLLSPEEREEVHACSGDSNENGINDCIEGKFENGSIQLLSDQSKYFYNSTGELRATILDKNGKRVLLDNGTNIEFRLIKIVDSISGNTIFDRNNDDLRDAKKTDKYLSFSNVTIPSTGGASKSSFSVKGKDSDLYFQSIVGVRDSGGEEVISLQSEIQKISVRGDRLFVSSSSLIDGVAEVGGSTLQASSSSNLFVVDGTVASTDIISQSALSSAAPEKLLLNLENISSQGNKISLAYPINISLFQSDKKIGEFDYKKGEIGSSIPLAALKESGNYRVEVQDNDGFSAKKEFEVLAGIPTNIDINLGSTFLQANENISANVVTLFDEFKNPTSGTFYNLDLEIDGDGIVFEQNNKKSLALQTFEGYKAFRIKSTRSSDNNTLKITLRDTNGKKILSKSTSITTLKKIATAFIPNGKVAVGGGKYNYKLTLSDTSGKTLSDFNSRVYMVMDSVYGAPTKPYFDLVNGKADIEYTTSSIAGKGIVFEFQIEGIGEIIQKKQTIQPGKPMKIDLAISQTKLEADKNESTQVNATLKDRFNNVVFNDSSSLLNLEILDRYKHVITADASRLKVKEGVVNFEIDATDNPGIAYFKVSADPDLSQNSFTIKGGTEAGDLVIKGVSEVVGKLETFFFWNKKQLKDSKYTSLYTTLLGANYGDITQKSYLAGELLFNRNNRSLAVTSILDNPYNMNDVLQVLSSGKIQSVASGDDLTQDLEILPGILNNRLYVKLFNAALGTYIGDIWYDFSTSDTQILACSLGVDCSVSDNETSLLLKQTSNSVNISREGDSVKLRDVFGKPVLEVTEEAQIIRSTGVEIIASNTQDGSIMFFDILHNGEKVAELGVNFIDAEVIVGRDVTSFENKINILSNKVFVLLKSNTYNSKTIYDGSNGGTAIYYNDPFSSELSLNSFSTQSIQGYENFGNQAGVGWKEGNKTLLSFAAGKTVGESVKDYASFGVINLGDPVVHLKKQAQKLPGTNSERKFDATVGTLLNNDPSVVSYELFDYDNDSKTDVLLLKDNNSLQLLENEDVEGNFINKGALAFLVDLGNTELVKTGDFTGDGYEDVFFVTSEGKPALLNNHKKDFYRVDLAQQFKLDGRIIRTSVFDMDNDGIDDVITLDDSGKIHIFYGNAGDNPVFTSKFITDKYGVNLDGTIRTDGAVVYHTGVPQSDDGAYNADILKSNEEYLSAIRNNIDIPNTNISTLNTGLLNRLLFVDVEYTSDKPEISASQGVISNTPDPTSADLTSSGPSGPEALSSFIQSNSSAISYSGYTGVRENKRFIKSEYSDLLGLKIEKKYSDINGGYVKAGEKIRVDITLTNTSRKKLLDIVYLEEVSKFLDLDTSSIIVGGGITAEESDAGYTFQVDDFNMSPGKELKISYEGTIRALSYGYIEAGLFETGEVGDDRYGDILVKKNNQNCGGNHDIFISTDKREYRETQKAPSCDPNGSDLPGNLQQNTIDENNNGIPDYIDTFSSKESAQGLISSTNGVDSTSFDTVQADPKIKDLTDQYLSTLRADTDGDGIPDNEDDTINAQGGIFKNLESINDAADKAGKRIDNLVESLSCGFGGGGCIATPLNWAPLAPGGDPKLFGMPIGDGLRVEEGIPVFSMLTGISGPFCIPIPMVWPASPFMFPTGTCGGIMAAGGALRAIGPMNVLRVFVTPTLTGGVGTATCFGGPAIAVGNSVPMGLAPLMPGGNCIVTATSLNSCNDDGSDGDVGSQGFTQISGLNGSPASFGVINGNCSAATASNQSSSLDSRAAASYLEYIRTGKASASMKFEIESSLQNISNGIPSGLDNGTLLSIGGNEGGSPTHEISLDFGGASGGGFSDIIEIKQKRVSAFPSFLMDWVTRQVEEIKTKLTDFPTVFIILPDFGGIFTDSSLSKESTDNLTVASVDVEIKGTNLAHKTKVESGIKEAYVFLGNTPLVNITQSPVDISVPVPDITEILKIEDALRAMLAQWQEELVSFTKVCEEEKGECDINAVSSLISQIEKNIEILESYREFPKELNKLINKKQDYLEQILCNIDAIGSLTSGWITENAKRFKTWIELYVLIKSILQSWQLLIDIFVDYEAECKECKNERGNLLDFQFKLISFILPKIPVIQFPKLPDIIIDLHQIRAGINITLPEFNISTRPVKFGLDFPELKLPDTPSASLRLPSIGLLPEFSLPELPDLPTLPAIQLPNLPPAPTLPKMFASLEGVLEIFKLLTKALCLLKISPLTPEWRAGDHIANLTDRTGYLSFDFIDLNFPQFSYPFVDAIKVTSYVNFEIETDFIVEFIRQAVLPINTAGGDMEHIINYEATDLDFSDTPKDLNIDVNDDGSIGYFEKNMKQLAFLFVAKIGNLLTYMETEGQETLSNDAFKQEIGNALASKEIAGNPRLDGLRDLWSTTLNLTYSKEDKLIKHLSEQNKNKFIELRNILNEEIVETKTLKKQVTQMNAEERYIQVSDTLATKTQDYQTRLQKYNDAFTDAARDLATPNKNVEKQELVAQGNKLFNRINSGLSSFESDYLADATNAPTGSSQNSCQSSGTSDAAYDYTYEGIYVLEEGVSYRLFSYLNELDGNEKTKIIDYDNDGDEDMIYDMNGQIFLKENLDITDKKVYISDAIQVLDSDDNIFYNNGIFIEAVNNFYQESVSNAALNLSFSSISQQVSNYRLQFYKYVDKFLNEKSSSYTPIHSRQTVIDTIASSNTVSVVSDGDIYTQRNNIAYIDSVGSDLSGVKLSTKKVKNIADDLRTGNAVTLTKGRTLYTGKSRSIITYRLSGRNGTITIPKHSNIELKQQIDIIGIDGNAYIPTVEDLFVTGIDIRNNIGLPLFFGDRLQSTVSSNGVVSPYVEIRYYDGSENNINFDEIEEYELYDLGNSSDAYTISLSRDNDFYYSKISGFKDDVYGTISAQTLLSPQVQGDNDLPELDFNTGIRVPVYQEKLVDLTPFIYEDGGVRGIEEVYIDFDLSTDDDSDSILENDNNLSDQIKIQKSLTSIQVLFGKFDELIQKKIRIWLVDTNGNKGFKDVNFEVYAPIPEITNYTNGKITGSINEALTDEPIHLYRFRGGQISKLKNTDNESLVTTQNGGYQFTSSNDQTDGLVLKLPNGNTIAEIDETTGVISQLGLGVTVEVIGSNNTESENVYPKIQLLSGGNDIYYQYLKMNNNSSVEVVDSLNDLGDDGMYIDFINTSSYTYLKTPDDVPFNPGAVSIYRAAGSKFDKNPLFTIFTDGRITTLSDKHTLIYDTSSTDYITLILRDENTRKDVAKILFKINGEYIMR